MNSRGAQAPGIFEHETHSETHDGGEVDWRRPVALVCSVQGMGGKPMTAADYRAALEKVLGIIHRTWSRSPEDGVAEIRRAISIPDAAAVAAQARREAIEECASMCESGSQIGVDAGGRTALLAMAACCRALAAQPAARGKKEQGPPESVPSDATMPPLAGQPGARAPALGYAQPPAPEPEVDVTDKDRMDYLESEMERELEWRKRSDLSEPCPRSLFRENTPITRKRIDEAIAQLRARASGAEGGERRDA